MALWAEWDPTTGNVVQIKNDDEQPGAHASGFTGADRTTGAETAWYPLEMEYPDDYIPRFPQLLGPGTMTLEDGVVHQRFPEANYSEQAVRNALRAEVNNILNAALGVTDWYFVRQAELGNPVPEDVKAERLRLRALGEQKTQAIDEATPSDLLDFDTSLLSGRRTWVIPRPHAVVR